MEHPPHQYTNEDLLKELENHSTQLDNFHGDVAKASVIIGAILLAILAVLLYKL